MDSNELQTVFRCTSFLLSYPNQQWREGLGDCEKELQAITQPQLHQPIANFLLTAKKSDPEKFIQEYIYLFDFGKKTNMYLTYGNNGEQRERGMELLALKTIYQAAGFKVTDQELPDYLPLLLEFASIANLSSVRTVLGKYQSQMIELKNKLIESESIYHHLLEASILASSQIEEEFSAEGSTL
ncbi:nitrate reductase delta subunit [Oikeobacillus pervagus]|uniref:Nitrate reductase delta subunit n=1 Tax=Oikeobacillus pervagus TaxID=1325931 RepID=A0AAJ1T786_9BACI|nr:nitrate reductase molybdenum cofactor assembly chaperone [Oikeobacillus pervagus]MDQ0216426.1 nitrate reductase delta subunit [Oikeobacillus pervagus]